MTDLNQLVEVGARAQMASAAYSSFWSVTDHKVMIKEGILAILPLLADDLAGVIQRRMDKRFAEHGTREPDTNATYYSGRAGELYESLDEEDEEIAHAIRTRIAAIIEGEGK
jgi:hypothetical protein